MNTLEHRGNRAYAVNLSTGKEYYLGYKPNPEHPFSMNTEQTRAIFFGSIDGVRQFFREKNGKVYHYAGDADLCVMWESDGEDEPSFPYVQTTFIGEITNRNEKNFILERIAQIRANPYHKA